MDPAPARLPARPAPPTAMPSSLRFVRALRDNVISVWPAEAYRREITEIRIGWRRMFAVNAPALARHVLLDNAANYSKSPLARRLFAPALGEGLITAEGDVWRRHRQIVAPAFAPRRMAALVPAMVAETLAHAEGWGEHGGAFDLTAALSDLTLAIIARTMFGAESAADIASIARDTDAYQKAQRPSVLDFIGAPGWVPRPGTRRARAIGGRLTAMIQRIIARRLTLAEPRDDLLALLLRAAERGEMNGRDVRDEIATAFTAGHETTAAALAWAFYLLGLHPDAERRVLDELRVVLGGRPPGADDLDRLPVTRMVAEETLRLYPPAHIITRLALGPDRLGPVAVPRGAVLLIPPWLLHRNPTLWPDPDRFDPDRFAPGAPGAPARARFSYLPFGAGPRICVGAGFAMTEIVAVLATVLQGWQVRLVPDHPVEPLALITLRPRFGLRATVARREAALPG